MTFLAGQVLTADDLNNAFPATVEDDEAANETNVSSTTFTAGATECSLTFTAPTSGQVLVTIHGALRADSGTDHIILSFEVREDGSAGTVVFAANDENAVSNNLSASLIVRGSTSKLVSGLTAGGTYYAQTMHRVTAGSTGDVLHRRIIVQPAT